MKNTSVSQITSVFDIAAVYSEDGLRLFTPTNIFEAASDNILPTSLRGVEWRVKVIATKIEKSKAYKPFYSIALKIVGKDVGNSTEFSEGGGQNQRVSKLQKEVSLALSSAIRSTFFFEEYFSTPQNAPEAKRAEGLDFFYETSSTSESTFLGISDSIERALFFCKAGAEETPKKS